MTDSLQYIVIMSSISEMWDNNKYIYTHSNLAMEV